MARYHVQWTIQSTHEDDVIIDDEAVTRDGFNPDDQDSVWSWLESRRTLGPQTLMDVSTDSTWVDSDDVEVISIEPVEDDE